MASSFVVYVDESGDEGFRFGSGSSEWFVLSAVITHRATDLPTVKLVDEARAELGKPPRKPLHFRDLRHEHRLPYLARIARGDLAAVAVLVHKPSLRDGERLRERYGLYFRATRELLARVSWYCQDDQRGAAVGDGSAEIIFSNRSGMSYQELCGYLGDLRQAGADDGARPDWAVIREDQVVSVSPGKRMGLQIADAVAGAFFCGVEASRYGFVEPRYAEMLRAVMYRHGTTCLGRGVVFWPEVAAELMAEEPYRWLGEVYA